MHRSKLEVYGMPQIDYIISLETLSMREINEQVLFFQKNRLWKEKEWA